ncbi:Phosphorelay intermediate protein [Savitreella phatthalungensis]
MAALSTPASTGGSDEGLVDHAIFDQLLEMDDDGDREFSRSIVWNFFEQAETTFTQIETALEKKELAELSSLGHFLKGSSAALGLTRVKESCEKIQHFGARKRADGSGQIDDEEALSKIATTLAKCKEDYREAEIYLKDFYGGEDGAVKEDD